jgi:hypothetical protein
MSKPNLDTFKKDLVELLKKHGFNGVMYNIRLENMPEDWSWNDLHTAYGADRQLTIIENIFNSKEKK